MDGFDDSSSEGDDFYYRDNDYDDNDSDYNDISENDDDDEVLYSILHFLVAITFSSFSFIRSHSILVMI